MHVIAGLQAAEALKLLAGRAESLLPGVVTIDLWQGTFEVMDLRGRAPWCPACTEGRYDYLGTSARRDAVRPRRGADPAGARRPSRPAGARGAARALRRRCAPTSTCVRFTAPEAELVVFEDGRAIVKGVAEPARARSLYAKYVGS